MGHRLDELKVCYVCKESKPRSEYYFAKNKVSSKCKECAKKSRVEIRKNRKLLEIHYKILLSLKTRLKNEFKRRGYSKPEGKTYEDIIGCDAIMLKEHLEKQFVDGMSWDNYGDWEVDHIFPLSKSENQESYEKNSHYTNIRPLFTIANRCKSDKLDYDKAPLFKYKQSIGSILSYSLSGFPEYRSKFSPEEILGIDYSSGLEYFESLFKDGMSWDNRSEWCFDHIVPISCGNTFEEKVYLNHHTNLQPLWKDENASKSNKINESNIDRYNKFLNEMRGV